MEANDRSFLVEMLRSGSWKIYEERLKELADDYRMQADQAKVEDKLWLLAKAQGIDEALKSPIQWLN